MIIAIVGAGIIGTLHMSAIDQAIIIVQEQVQEIQVHAKRLTPQHFIEDMERMVEEIELFELVDYYDYYDSKQLPIDGRREDSPLAMKNTISITAKCRGDPRSDSHTPLLKKEISINNINGK